MSSPLPSSTQSPAVELNCLTFPVASSESSHYYCCANKDVSVCGQDISALPFVDRDGPSGCAVCDFLTDTDFCPLGLICEDDS